MRIFATVVLLTVILSACTRSNDSKTAINNSTLKPVISVAEINMPIISEFLCGSKFDNVIKINTGTSLIMKMRLKGGTTLSQYKIDIHNNFDCHMHGAKTTATPWQLLKVVDLSSSDTTVTEEMTVPADAAVGNYHMMIQLIDSKGNDAPFVEYNLIIVNSIDPEKPKIILTSPSLDSFAANKGDTILFRGTVTDNYSLKNGKLEIKFADAKTGEIYSVLNRYFGDTAKLNYDLDGVYIIPSFPSGGVTKFSITTYDEVNNKTEKYLKINIK
jgi:hypothetical protein